MSKKEKNLSSLENISYENGDGLTEVSLNAYFYKSWFLPLTIFFSWNIKI